METKFVSNDKKGLYLNEFGGSGHLLIHVQGKHCDLSVLTSHKKSISIHEKYDGCTTQKSILPYYRQDISHRKESGRMIYVMNCCILSRKCISKHNSISTHTNCEIKRGNQTYACRFYFGFSHRTNTCGLKIEKKLVSNDKKGLYLHEFGGSGHLLIHVQGKHCNLSVSTFHKKSISIHEKYDGCTTQKSILPYYRQDISHRKESGRMIYVMNCCILSRKCISKHNSISTHTNCEIRENQTYACRFYFGFSHSTNTCGLQIEKKLVSNETKRTILK